MDGAPYEALLYLVPFKSEENKNYVNALHDTFFGIKSHVGQIKKIAVQ
jgi:hypothetical protein